ncbi:MAG: hypothetical protein AAB393_06420 [Bacteroidota bacterium]
MKKLLIFAIAFGLVAGSALAQNRNPCPGDKEYQFNIIGTKDKNPDMTGNNGHRIFVKLTGTSNIYMTGDTSTATGLQCGTKFDVLDANGTDANGATLLVPCDPLTATNLNPSVCFDVYATPLAHGGYANVDVVCTFDSTCLGCNIDSGSCATGNIDFSLTRGSGKPVTQNITKFFRATGCIDLDASGTCNAGDISFSNEWIFNIAALEEYYWAYDNHGNRLTQIRFCDVEGVPGSDCGPNVIVQ